MKYQIIYADPPWQYGNWYQSEDVKRNAADHYQVMDVEEICDLPVGTISDENCALFLWVTFPCLLDGLRVLEAWGFRYTTCGFTWVKMNATGFGIFTGLGNYTRANTELCLLGMKGSLPRISRSVRQVVLSPVLKHSQKPSIIREGIVQLFGDLPRIELFARQKVEGWDCWGNEAENDIEL